MYQSTCKTVVACLVTAALAAYSWTARAQDIERSFTVAEGDRVVVDVERADLNITAWDRAEVGVSIGNSTERHEFDFSQEDGVVIINGEYDRPGFLFVFGGFSNRRSAVVTMNVPYRQHLDLRTSGGDIELDRLQGEFAAHTSGGDIEADAIDGPADVRTSGGDIMIDSITGAASVATSGGDIEIGAVSGEIEMRTSGGDINLEQAGGAVSAGTSGGDIQIGNVIGSLNARTSGGDIEAVFSGAEASGGGELRTTGGDVVVYLPADAQVEIDANAMGGGVSSEFEGAETRRSAGRGSLDLSLNGGGPELVLRTTGGSIEILRPDS